MSSSESSDGTVSLKLLIDTKGKIDLFAEAGKDFVDFLFRILSLPIGTIINLLKKQELVGSLANLYQSIETYTIHTYNQTKPKTPFWNQSPLSRVLFLCLPLMKHLCRRLRSSTGARAANSQYEKLVSEEGGFVKGVVTYMVMDDLVVTPLSTISSITLLNKFNVKEVGSLEEKVVSFGVDEPVKLLNASLHSKKVLTDVFLEDEIIETNVDEC
ncbi:hypothetical protein CASFOL_035016 [Castilleja foliolosa]|uniref:DUF674 domain-containing protein n=1 Tax=Castilleja foliolosa TaxID=1961234 RepID=A0ABD3BSD9_9LAMI